MVDKDIWRTYSFTDKLYVICKKLHILKLAQFINRKILHNETKNDNEEEFPNMTERLDLAIERFLAIPPSNKKKIVFSGHILEFDKGTCAYLNQIEKAIPEAEMILLSHAVTIPHEKSYQLLNFMHYTLPFTASLNRYDKNIDVEISEEAYNTIQKKDYLQLAIERLTSRHKDMGVGYPEMLVYCLYKYFDEFLAHFTPDVVVLWCDFFCGHNFLNDMCKERDIEVIFMEFGALPGTFAIEQNGQMGESDVAVKYEEFLQKEITEKELVHAEDILAFLKESKLNRRPQQKTDALEKIASKYMPGRPTIVYFGQNDYEAGIKPYTTKSQKFHSPIFKSSDEAAHYLARMTKRNKWNFIYKPHQMMVRVGECLEKSFDNATIWIGDSDINELIDLADVCITTVSQCGYISLIREKPLIMLGYTQLRGKQCNYEAFNKEQIELAIEKALQSGYTLEQRKQFQKHVAQLLKYYLFDDEVERELPFGQPVESAVKLFKDILNKSESYTCNENRKLLFYCQNKFEVLSATSIMNSVADSIRADIIITESNGNISDILNKNKFENIISFEGKIEEFLESNNMENLLCKEVYTDFYICDYNNEIIELFNRIIVYNPILKTHFYDGANLKFYLKDIAKDIERTELYIQAQTFFESICEISLFNRTFLVWREKVSIPITIMPTLSMPNIKNLTKCTTKFLMTDNFLFQERYTSNEMDIIEEIASRIGTENIAVCTEIETQRYTRRKLNISKCSTEEAIMAMAQNTNEKVFVFSFLCNSAYYYSMLFENVIYIDLGELLICKDRNSIFVSNSYKKFRTIVNESMKERFFVPTTYESLMGIISYEGGKQ